VAQAGDGGAGRAEGVGLESKYAANGGRRCACADSPR
jgi:hypothetical protein